MNPQWSQLPESSVSHILVFLCSDLSVYLVIRCGCVCTVGTNSCGHVCEVCVCVLKVLIHLGMCVSVCVYCRY